MNRESIEINVDKVTVKGSLRTDHGDLSSLKTSISKMGLLHPIIVDQNNVLISGARRLQACRELGRERVNALRFNIRHDSLDALNIQSDDNLCRLPLSSQELDALIQKKKNMLGHSGAKRSAGIVGWIKKIFKR